MPYCSRKKRSTRGIIPGEYGRREKLLERSRGMAVARAVTSTSRILERGGATPSSESLLLRAHTPLNLWGFLRGIPRRIKRLVHLFVTGIWPQTRDTYTLLQPPTHVPDAPHKYSPSRSVSPRRTAVSSSFARPRATRGRSKGPGAEDNGTSHRSGAWYDRAPGPCGYSRVGAGETKS